MGRGLGRYFGLNLTNAAVLDANGNLEAIDSMGCIRLLPALLERSVAQQPDAGLPEQSTTIPR